MLRSLNKSSETAAYSCSYYNCSGSVSVAELVCWKTKIISVSLHTSFPVAVAQEVEQAGGSDPQLLQSACPSILGQDTEPCVHQGVNVCVNVWYNALSVQVDYKTAPHRAQAPPTFSLWESTSYPKNWLKETCTSWSIPLFHQHLPTLLYSTLLYFNCVPPQYGCGHYSKVDRMPCDVYLYATQYNNRGH